MTHDELRIKYDAAAKEAQKIVGLKISSEWDFYTVNETYHTVMVWDARDDEDGTCWEVYDRMDSPCDRDIYGETTVPTWVVMHGHRHLEHTAPTLKEALIWAVKEGWFPGQSDPTV